MNKKLLLFNALLVVAALHPIGIEAQVPSDKSRTVYNYVFAPSEGIVNRTEMKYRKELCLNGFWDFQPVGLPSGYVQGKGVTPELALPSESAWSTTKIKIPSPWNVNSFAYRDLEGPDHRNYPSYPKEWEQTKMAWMRKVVTVPEEWAGEDIRLYFEAVAGYAEVYVNGKKRGENFDIFLPFTVDITDDVIAGQKVEILVGVRSQALFENNSTIGRRILPAGSMWGSHIAGIWQDVYLLALPKVHIEDVFVKPLVSQNMLELEVEVKNNTAQKADLKLLGEVREWINLAGTDVNSAPVPTWELGMEALKIGANAAVVEPNSTAIVTVRVPVAENVLKYWTPEHPNLYALLLSLNTKKQTLDLKYERFGWREWTLKGTEQCLNGEPYVLHGDSWHFMGIPQMTRRYAWAWFSAIKNMNGNAVRPHAQVYPRLYLDMADEMGICVLDETANWGSDGGPKFDDERFWESSKEHLRRFVLRDRNHASVFGWSISNENKPVILNVFHRPDLMPLQEKAWEQWRDIVRENDSTRPWISSDGEDDGNGILPVTVGHYGDMNSMKNWQKIGKPWGIGEHSMAYYGTPEQVSVYNGERAYESQEGRMEGLANECYNLIANQRAMGASYSTVFNMVWYALKPLPLGKKNLGTAPSLTEDGIFFTEYKEGVPGVQPERMGPYCTTFNPGYDPNLPLYQTWPLYDAMRAANAPFAPAWSPYASVDKSLYEAPQVKTPKSYAEVCFVGDVNGKLKRLLDLQGVVFSSTMKSAAQSIYIVDGSRTLTAEEKTTIMKNIDKGADVWIWGITPQTLESYKDILPLEVELDVLKRSSFLPVQRSWMRGLNNSDFYFCEIQRADASEYSLKGRLVEEGEILLEACRTDWRKWNKRPEEIKIAGTVRSENECTSATPVFVKYGNGQSDCYLSTLTEFADSEKGFNTLSMILAHAGIPCTEIGTDAEAMFFLRDNQLEFPASSKGRLVKDGDGLRLNLYVFSPRPLDDLLIEPNMPKLSLTVTAKTSRLEINGKVHSNVSRRTNDATYNVLPLTQGWNMLSITIDESDRRDFGGLFKCDNRSDFLSLIKVSFENPESNK